MDTSTPDTSIEHESQAAASLEASSSDNTLDQLMQPPKAFKSSNPAQEFREKVTATLAGETVKEKRLSVADQFKKQVEESVIGDPSLENGFKARTARTTTSCLSFEERLNTRIPSPLGNFTFATDFSDNYVKYLSYMAKSGLNSDNEDDNSDHGSLNGDNEDDNSDHGSLNGDNEDGNSDHGSDGSLNGGSEDGNSDHGFLNGDNKDDNSDHGSFNGGSEDDNSDHGSDGSLNGDSEDDSSDDGSLNGNNEDDSLDHGSLQKIKPPEQPYLSVLVKTPEEISSYDDKLEEEEVERFKLFVGKLEKYKNISEVEMQRILFPMAVGERPDEVMIFQEIPAETGPAVFNIADVPANTPDFEQMTNIWSYNLIDEMKKIRTLLQANRKFFVGIDTEFPGFLFQELYSRHADESEMNFNKFKANVDLMHVIQIGLTFFYEDGQLADYDGIHTWQVNLNFDALYENRSDSSVIFLVNSGIKFAHHRKYGIRWGEFAALLVDCGLVGNPNVTFLTFHGTYDFGYLVKFLRGRTLPKTAPEFLDVMNIYFPYAYDIKVLSYAALEFQGSLEELMEKFKIQRLGKCHNGGSDAYGAGCCYFAIRNMISKNGYEFIEKEINGRLWGINLSYTDIQDVEEYVDPAGSYHLLSINHVCHKENTPKISDLEAAFIRICAEEENKVLDGKGADDDTPTTTIPTPAPITTPSTYKYTKEDRDVLVKQKWSTLYLPSTADDKLQVCHEEGEQETYDGFIATLLQETQQLYATEEKVLVEYEYKYYPHPLLKDPPVPS